MLYDDAIRLYDDRYGMDGVDITGQYRQPIGSITNAIQTYTTTRLPLSAAISSDYAEMSTCTAREIPSDGRYYYGLGAFSIADAYDIEIAADGSSIRLVSKERKKKEPDPTLTQDQQQKFFDLI